MWATRNGPQNSTIGAPQPCLENPLDLEIKYITFYSAIRFCSSRRCAKEAYGHNNILDKVLHER